MIRDLRHAIRLLLRTKGWTLTVVLLLALGIGANTAIFAAINGLLLRTVPVAHPETLVRFRWLGDNDMGTDFSDYGFVQQEGGQRLSSTFSYPMYQQFRDANKTLEDLFACAPEGRVNVAVNGTAEIATKFIASGNYFDVLGVHALLGRTFTAADDRLDAPPVAVISYGYWMRRFGGDRAAVGKVLTIGDLHVTVVGVTPREFTGVQQVLADNRDITIPLALDPLDVGAAPTPGPPRLQQPTNWWLQVMGRLKPGVTPEQAQGNFEGLFQAQAREGWASYFRSLSPKEQGTARNQDRTKVPRLRVQPGGHGFYDPSTDTFRSITLLSIVVNLVLLIVCANVANLLLARATARRREIAVRMAIGATRARLVRQLLTESVLLAAIGAVAGTVVAYWGTQLLPNNLRPPLALDWRILLFIGGLTLATGILFGVAPALRSSRLDLDAMMKEGSHSIAGARSRLGKTLVAVQVAISLVLLVVAGLFVRTVSNLRNVDVGFETNNLLLVPVSPALQRYDTPRTQALMAQLLDELPHVPGLRAVTASRPALLSGSVNGTSIWIQGRASRTDRNNINRLVIAPNFFDALGMRMIAGRAFNERDTQTAPKVVVVNQAAANKYFPRESAVGHRLGQSFETSADYEIVGVVSDAKYNSLRDAPPPTLYVPYPQARVDTMSFALRTAADPRSVTDAVRAAFRRIDPNLPILNITTQAEQIEVRLAQEKTFAQACALFAGLALVIASVGLFGLMSYNVARRRSEIGIRVALGAQRQDIVALVMRESLVLVAAGVVAGAAIALGSTRLVASFLYNLAPNDPATLAVASLILVLCSLVAGYMPARVAAQTDPMVALREN